MRRTKPNRLHSGQSGYVLLAVMLAMTMILIAMSVEAPRIAQQIKRQREEELVHRGKDYATAVKRFVHKNGGQYPTSIEQLENTNHVRFLRKRYKDPMTGDSDWRLVHYGEAQVTIPAPNPGGLNNSTQPGSGPSSGPVNPSNPSSPPPTTGPNTTQQNPPPSSLTTSNIGNGQTAGGGPIIGVASVNKGHAIKEFNDKDHYNDWLFVYDLRLEQSGGTGVTVAAPMSPGAANAGGAPNANNPNGSNNSNNPPGAGGPQNPPTNGQLPPGTSPPPPSPSPN
jgi:type II secretory pathway pseudopilin PulG